MKRLNLIAGFLLIFKLAFCQSDPCVFLVTADGLREQEVFQGADSALMHNPRFTTDSAFCLMKYWHEARDRRRELLMPFFTRIIARQGFLMGDPEAGEAIRVKNPYKISYPGYNEMLSGRATMLPLLNIRFPNPNGNVLSELNRSVPYANAVAAFGSWDVLKYIINDDHLVKASFGHNLLRSSGDSFIVSLNVLDLADQFSEHTRNDELTYLYAVHYIRQYHPKVVFLSLGGMDEYAHRGNYLAYLDEIHHFDRVAGELWQLIQSDAFYKDRTHLIMTTDHGRGAGEDWTNHNAFVRGSANIWLAMLGPGRYPYQPFRSINYQKQIAGIIRRITGIDQPQGTAGL